MCTNKFAKRAIISTILVSFLFSIYKPVISTAIETKFGTRICTWKPEHKQTSFIMDSIYALMITAILFAIICTFKLLVLITRTLLKTRQWHKRNAKFTSEDSIVKLEFTFLLLVVSSCFIALNLPYFAVFCERLKQQIQMAATTGSVMKSERMRGMLYITKTIFSFNYCINFFLYSLTGIHFRRQLKNLLCHKTVEQPRTLVTRTAISTQDSTSANGMYKITPV